MSEDVNEMVLDAFRAEHREQLEQIRTLLGSLHPGEDVANDPRVQDAFRLAHSFKGGARVCDLREAERLGHGLEAVLERLGHGELRLTDEVVATVTCVLDCIEDCMAALDEEQPAPDTSEALGAIDRVLAERSSPAASACTSTNNSSRLLEAFCQEYAQHSARLRQFASHWSSTAGRPGDEELSEAARLAHTLAGAAGIVVIRPVETAAHRLEELFRAAQADKQPFDADALQQVEDSLDAMAQVMRNRCPEILPAERVAADEGINRQATGVGGPAGAAGVTTVRVSVESLDRLMRSCGELMADNQHVSRLTRQISALRREVHDLEREREAIRRAALPSLHKLAATPEFERIARYFEYVDRQVSSLAKQSRQLSVSHRRLAWLLRARSAQVQRDVHEARLVPAHSVFQGFRKMVRDLAKAEGKEIDFEAAGLDVRADRMVLQELKDSIMHVLRNCVSHGIETPQERRDKGKPEKGRVAIRLEAAGGRLVAVVEDDGRGVDVEQIGRQAVARGLWSAAVAEHQSSEEIMAVLFEPGFSTIESVTKLAGRGMGLSVVREAVTRLQGQVTVSPAERCGVRVTLSVPNIVSTHRVLLVRCGNQTVAIPTQAIERLLRIAKEKVESVEGQPVVTYDRRLVRLTRLADVLGVAEPAPDGNHEPMLSVVLLKSGSQYLAVSVDALLEERDSVVLNLDEFAESSRFAGGILLEDAQVALIVRPTELMQNARRASASGSSALAVVAEQAEVPKVLIVDDSFTTRTLEKSILESQGYEVRAAVDGIEAMSQMRQQKFDVVISDIEMPRMDGYALLEQMKADKRLADTPVILVTSRDRSEDQQHGLNLGADAYIVKRKFDHQELLSTVRQLL